LFTVYLVECKVWIVGTDAKEQQLFSLGKVKLVIWVNPIGATKQLCAVNRDNAILKDKQ